MAEVKPGAETTEYGLAKGANTWAIITTVVGLLVTVGNSVVTSLGVDSTAGIIVGAVISVIGIVMKTANSLGYGKGRVEVKKAAAGPEL